MQDAMQRSFTTRILAAVLGGALLAVVVNPTATAAKWQDPPPVGATRNPVIVRDTTVSNAVLAPIITGSDQVDLGDCQQRCSEAEAYASWWAVTPAPGTGGRGNWKCCRFSA